MGPKQLDGYSYAHVMQDPAAFFAQQRAAKTAASQPKQQRGKGGILSSLISEIGGGAGAATGAAIGSALLPGIGTIAGGALGGLLGGTGGRVVENKVRDNRYGIGDALKEGATDAALSGLGEAFGLAKAGKAATGASSLLHPVENIGAGAAARASGAAATGGIESIGKGIEAGGMGLAQGAGAPGISKIGAQESDELVNALTKEFKIPAGSPESIQRALGPKLDQLGKNIATKYAQANVPLADEELKDLGANIIHRATTMGGIDSTVAGQHALGEANKLAEAGDVKGLWKYSQDLDESINFARNSASATPEREAVARIIRDEVRPLLDAKVPGLAADNALYHNGSQANQLLKAASTNSRGGLTSRVLGLGPVKSGEAKVGSLIQKGGQLLAGTGGAASKLTNSLVRQAPGGLARAIGGLNTPTDDPTASPALDYSGIKQFNPVGLGLGDDATAAPSQPTYSLQQALADSQRDPKNAAQYLAYAKAFSDEAASSTGGANITKVTSQQYGLAQSGQQALQGLTQLISKDPNIINKAATPGRGLPVVGGVISRAAGTGQYDAIGYNIADSLLRLRTGAQANESEIKNLQTQIMPRAGDSDATVQAKIKQINDIFGSVLTLANGSTPQATSLNSILQTPQ